ncbi:MAG: hypothetical protein FMNOHCHN_03521 [Ignavibacteriaceae bacterium]|nr:hypothetical protein [Ignavibacteriaceae bacterium]
MMNWSHIPKVRSMNDELVTYHRNRDFTRVLPETVVAFRKSSFAALRWGFWRQKKQPSVKTNGY